MCWLCFDLTRAFTAMSCMFIHVAVLFWAILNLRFDLVCLGNLCNVLVTFYNDKRISLD